MKRFYKLYVTPFQLRILESLLEEASDDVTYTLEELACEDWSKTCRSVDSLYDKVHKAMNEAGELTIYQKLERGI